MDAASGRQTDGMEGKAGEAGAGRGPGRDKTGNGEPKEAHSPETEKQWGSRNT